MLQHTLKRAVGTGGTACMRRGDRCHHRPRHELFYAARGVGAFTRAKLNDIDAQTTSYLVSTNRRFSPLSAVSSLPVHRPRKREGDNQDTRCCEVLSADTVTDAARAGRGADLSVCVAPNKANMGSNPHFGAILNFFGPRKNAHVSTHSTWPLSKTPFVLWCLPLAPYRQARKNIRQETAGILAVGVVQE